MVSHPHYPLPRTKLASLVKGRWIDGKPQALILLLSVCDTPTFFYLSNFSAVKTEGLLYTHQPLHPTTLSKPHQSSPLATALASLVKGEVLSPEKIRATTGGIDLHPPASPSPQPSQNHIHPSPLTTTLAFCNANICMRRYAFTSALSHPLFVGEWACPSRRIDPPHPHQPFQNRTIPSLRTMSLPPLSKVRCCRPKNSGDYRRDCCTNPSKTALSPRSAPCPCLPCQR